MRITGVPWNYRSIYWESCYAARNSRSMYVAGNSPVICNYNLLLQHARRVCPCPRGACEARSQPRPPTREPPTDRSASRRPTPRASSSCWRTIQQGASGRWVSVLHWCIDHTRVSGRVTRCIWSIKVVDQVNWWSDFGYQCFLWWMDKWMCRIIRLGFVK